MNKYLSIALMNGDSIVEPPIIASESDSLLLLGRSDSLPLLSDECKNIVDQIYKQNRNLSTMKNLRNAIDVVIAYMHAYNMNCVTVDISKRNDELSPVKKMTLEDIEGILGYKIQIVDKQED